MTIMKRFISIICSTILLLSACTQHEEFSGSLAVDSYSIEVGRDEGFTRVMVYGADRWHAEFVEDVEWATLDEFNYGSGRGSFRLNFAANEKLNRVAKIRITGNGESLMVDVYQEAGKVLPTLTISETAVSVPANHYKISIPVSQTLIAENLEHLKYVVVVGDEESAEECGWISAIGLNDELTALEMDIARNDSGAERVASVTLSMAGADNEAIFERSVDVCQLAAEASVEATVQPEYRHSPVEQECVIPLRTNAGYMAHSVEVEIGGQSAEQEWVRDVKLGAEALTFTLAGNDGDDIRQTDVRVWLTDADGISTNPIEFRVLQGYYRKITVAELRQIAATDGYTFDDSFMSYSVEGVVVSDCDSKNNALNPNTAYSTLDMTVSDRTVYLQNEDGACGVRLLLNSADDNIFHRGDKVTVGLGGLTIGISEAPKCWSIERVPAAAVMSHTPATGDVVEKRKRIAELTDDDIYTLVTLTDVEFVFKQGAYTNINESYVQKSALNTGNVNIVHIGDSAARLMQDVDGDAIFMQINSLCQWRRTLNVDSEGNHGVPQGVGALRGVVVAEKNSRYGDSTNNIGRYSIRPKDVADIAIPWAASSARTTLAAWHFDNKVSGAEIHTASTNGTPGEQYGWVGTFGKKATSMNRMKATDGDTSAALYCDNLSSIIDKVVTSFYATVSTACRPIFTDGYESAYIWDGLGNNGNGYWKSTTDTWSGCGISGRNVVHFCGRNELGDYTWVTNLSGWYDNDDNGPTRGFMLELSTAGVASPLTLTFSMGVGGQSCTDWTNYISTFLNKTKGYYSQNYPLYWKVQYSTDGGLTWLDGAVNSITGASEFMLHPVPAWSDTAYSDPATSVGGGTAYPNAQMSLGLVEYSFRLPAAASGVDNVIVKIIPANKRIATLVAGAENYALPLDQGRDFAKGDSFGNIIHFGGIQIQY